jgi:predicted negative regulator of RcsB-dependent stress response|tara:strand:- start:2114 stop:2755 length:642 start_codon:yes stop_codon:yes gene_type:complete
MDEDISIINQNTRNEYIKNFFKKNFKKLLFIISIFLLILLSFFIYESLKKNKRYTLAKKYNDIIINNKNYTNPYIIENLKFIIDKKDKVYSPLALYYLLDNNYINSQNDINLLFDKIISIKQSNEKKHLIIFKKALFNLDNFTENQMLETLNPVINSDSVWKAHGLLLMAEFYLDKKELIKSKEFFTKVSEIENLNQSIKQDVQKKLSREFSE